jgi:hypothetical protein
MLATLEPSFSFDALHPRGAVLMGRSSLERTRWFGIPVWRLDGISGITIACMGAMPLICHEGVATEAALAFLELSGIGKPQSLLLYRSEAEAVARARECVAAGATLAYVYPPPADADAAGTLLVPLERYAALNNKARLGELVAAEHLPPRRFHAPGAIAGLRGAWPGRAVFVKAAIDGAHGAGADVRCCTSASEWSAALSWLQGERAHLTGILVEDAIDFVATWCLGFAVLEDRCLGLGAAEQLFGTVGVQSGSRIDPQNPAPERAFAIGRAIAERARALGYRGVCGFDMGQDARGRVFVFDLNFRVNACTPQLLLHDAAVRRIGASVSQSFVFRPEGALADALARLRPYAEDGRVVPLRIFDAGLSEEPDARSTISGMLLAGDAAGANALEAEIAARLAPR